MRILAVIIINCNLYLYIRDKVLSSVIFSHFLVELFKEDLTKDLKNIFIFSPKDDNKTVHLTHP